MLDVLLNWLNRLIKKVQLLGSNKLKTPFHQKIQLLVAEGKLDIAIAKTLIKVFEENSKQEE